MDAAGARVEYRELLAERPPTPCERALKLLGVSGSGVEAQAVFNGRATRWQITEWRLGRNGMPEWAVDILRLKLAQAGELYRYAQEDLVPGPGLGWNKNATRGLGEWRARKNLRQD